VAEAAITPSPGERWLVVGHGSVGSFLTGRLATNGASVFVYDPKPRVPVSRGRRVDGPDLPGGPVGLAVSCVPPDAADAVPEVLNAAVRPDGVVFDWNTVSPSLKQRIREQLAARMVDVALLDSLDGTAEEPMLAVSGEAAGAAAALLAGHGFSVVVAGEEVGEAAALKYLRSVFMKSLEALVLEYASLASTVAGEQIVRSSLENNLGERFVSFMDLLLATNRIHAERRGLELEDAVATFSADGSRPELATAAVHVLRQAAQAWAEPSAPAAGASLEALADHLHRTLWRQPTSI
jgi:hypothetical protein